MALGSTILDLVGNTPLLRIPQSRVPGVDIFAKLESANPSGSVKDRAARAMLLDGLTSGALEGKALLEATSGNTGIAFAMMCASLDIPCELCLPTNASSERKMLLAQYGVTLHLTSPMEGTDGAQNEAVRLMDAYPERYFYPDQYNNANNWMAHVATTGPEIWDQTEGCVTHFVAGLGTTGTFMGTSKYLQEKGVVCVSVQPDNPIHGLEGWKHMESARVPGIYEPTAADAELEADTVKAFQTAIAASRQLGLSISPSAAANLNAALELAEQIGTGTIVTVITDNAMKYLQDPFWTNDEFHGARPFG